MCIGIAIEEDLLIQDMKILVVALRYFGTGGTETVMRNLNSTLSKFGDLEISILTNAKSEDNLVYGTRFYDIPFLNNLEPTFLWRRKLREAVDNFKPDLIHMHSCVMPLPNNIPSLMTVHGTYKNEIPHLLSYQISPFYKAFYSSLVYSQYLHEKHTYKFAKYYHSVSTHTKEELIEMGVPPKKIFVIPNGVDTDRFYPKDTKVWLLDKLNLQENVKIVLCVCNIVPRKGIHVLIKAIHYILKEYHTHFVFVGRIPKLAGSYIKYLDNLARSLKVKNYIHFIGRVSSEELVAFYNACDLFVSPSLSEGFGLNILEAAACGKKVVATDVGGARDILGEYGCYTEPNNYKDLAKNIIRMLNKDRNALKNREKVAKEFSWSKVAKRVKDLYEKCIKMDLN